MQRQLFSRAALAVAALLPALVPTAAVAQVEVETSDVDTFYGGDVSINAQLDDALALHLRGSLYEGPFRFGLAIAEIRQAGTENVTVEAGCFGLFLPDSPQRPNFRDHRARVAVSARTRIGNAAFVQDEVFYDLDDDRVTRNHLTAGIFLPVSESVSLIPAFQFLIDRSRRPNASVFSVGTSFGL